MKETTTNITLTELNMHERN